MRMSGFKKAKFHFSEDTEFVCVSAYRLQADAGWGGLVGFRVVRADFAQVANPSGTEFFPVIPLHSSVLYRLLLSRSTVWFS